MAQEEMDPFEAALASLGNDINQDQASDGKEADPFSGAESTEGFSFDEESQKPSKEVSLAAEKSVASSEGGGAGSINLDFLLDVKLNLTFEVGRSKMLISDLLTLGQGSVIELNRLVGEDLNIYVNGQLLATGEVVVINEHFGARISEIVSPEERILRMYND